MHKKKPLIGKIHGDRANVDKTNAAIVVSKDDKGDNAKGTESYIDHVAEIERDKAYESPIDAVAKNKTGELPQESDSKAIVEQLTEAPQQQQSQQPCSSTDDAGSRVQQRNVEQIIDVPDDAEEEAQQRTVEQIVDAPAETVPPETVPTETGSETLDHESLDVTRRVERPPARAKAAPRYECSLMRGVRLELERVRYE